MATGAGSTSEIVSSNNATATTIQRRHADVVRATTAGATDGASSDGAETTTGACGGSIGAGTVGATVSSSSIVPMKR
jgi:hypothetical protein